MNIPGENPQIFYRVVESMTVRWMQQGMLTTDDDGTKRYFPHSDWICIRSSDAHHLAYSVDWGDLATIIRRKELREKLNGGWRGSHVVQVGPVQLANRRKLKASPLFRSYGFEEEP